MGIGRVYDRINRRGREKYIEAVMEKSNLEGGKIWA